jgi:hypothetical protein
VGEYIRGGEAVSFSNPYRPGEIAGAKFILPLGLKGSATIWGLLSREARTTKGNVIREINLLRKAEGLDDLPKGVECEKVDAPRKDEPHVYQLAFQFSALEPDTSP